MYSCKCVCLLAIFATLLTMINGQFGGFGVPSLIQTAANTAGQFSNSNTNFQQTRGGSFGAVAAFGSGGSSTNFNQQNTNAGFSNGFQSFGVNPGFNRIFRAEDEDLEDEEQAMSKFRYASPYDIPTYKPAKAAKPAYQPSYKPAYAPAPAYVPAPQPVQCPQNLLVGCAPQVQYVPCSAPPSYGYPKY